MLLPFSLHPLAGLAMTVIKSMPKITPPDLLMWSTLATTTTTILLCPPPPPGMLPYGLPPDTNTTSGQTPFVATTAITTRATRSLPTRRSDLANRTVTVSAPSITVDCGATTPDSLLFGSF